MSHPTRRQFLALSTASIGAFAGCAIQASGSPDVTLGGIGLVNTMLTEAEFDVIVESNDEIVYWESHEIDPAPSDGETNTEIIVPDLPDDPGIIVVRGRVDGQRRIIDLGEDNFNGECVLPSFIWKKTENGLGTTVNLVKDLPDLPEEVSCQN